MLINIIFISKQTKIADFHTLYIMRCRHPKETATLKKNRNVTPTAFLTHRRLRTGQFKSSSTNSTRAIPFGPPLEKAGRHRRFPTPQTFQRYEHRRQAQHFRSAAACAGRTKTIASAQLHGSNSLAASQFRPPAGLKTALNVGQNRRSARK